jgi:hypothetical protein
LAILDESDALDDSDPLPDTTHQELADVQDTPAALLHTIDDHGHIAYRLIVSAANFADSFVVRNL